MNMNLLPTIEAKSDQLNAEDLIGGPRTVRVTDVRLMDSDDQPLSIYFEGDKGKPFKPCKTVRRLLVRAWGPDGAEYIGRSMTLYLDPEVKYGGLKVGGIRVSHVSHIDGPQSWYLAETRGKKRQITVKPLKDGPKDGPTLEEATERLRLCDSLGELKEIWTGFKQFHNSPDFAAAKDERKAQLSESGF